MLRIGFIIGLFSLGFIACVPPTKEIKSDVTLDIKSPMAQKVIDFQDQMLTDSIFPYFNDEDPTYKFLAIRSFASSKDTRAIDSLIQFLDDPNMDIRSMSAYALGQIAEERTAEALIQGFVDQDTLNVDNMLNANILEALGKIGNEAIMANIASVESYRRDDTTLLLGQMRSLYRFGLRNIKNQDATNTAVKYVTDKAYPEPVRVMAANYLSRNKDLDLTLGRDDLIKTFKRDDNPNIRMGIAIALQNFKDDEGMIGEIMALFDREKDYRVKTYLIKSLSEFPYIKVVEQMIELAKNTNAQVAQTATQFFINKGNGPDSPYYKEVLTDDTPWQVRALVYKALFKHTPIYYSRVKNKLKREVLAIYEESDNVYEKTALIDALSMDPYQYTTLLEFNRNTKNPVIKTAIAQGLKDQVLNKNFIKAYGGNYIRTARSIADSLIVEAKNGGSGVVANLALLLKNKDFNWNRMIRDTSWREDILSALKLPRDVEAHNEFSGAIASVDGTSFTPMTPEYNHPIDWSVLSTITDSSRLVMKTSKGNITIKLFQDESPGSVVNFLKLCQSDYYDGKVFHRVVPNFVIQGGCPIGDGYGGLDYTIRSELGPLYYDDEGYVGMASAGNHTEGVQFFITHSPTPHLDGRYTIFGKVIEGMRTVHDIEVGDKIIDAILVKQ